VEPARVRTCATAQPDHAVFLTTVQRPARIGGARGPKHAHGCLLVALRYEQVTGRAIALQPERIPVLFTERPPIGAPPKPGKRPDIQRIEVELLGLVAQSSTQRCQPACNRLPAKTIHQVDIQRREAGGTDLLKRTLNIGVTLRAPGRRNFGLDKALYPNTNPVD